MVSNDGGTLIKTILFGNNGTEVLYGVQFDNKGLSIHHGYNHRCLAGDQRRFQTGQWQTIHCQTTGQIFPILSIQPLSEKVLLFRIFHQPLSWLTVVKMSMWPAGAEVLKRKETGSGAAVYNNSTTTGFTVTPNALKKTTDGADFYFFVMKKDAAASCTEVFSDKQEASVIMWMEEPAGSTNRVLFMKPYVPIVMDGELSRQH